MTDIFDQSLIDEFIADCGDHLEAIEPDLLSLEQDGSQVSPEIINRVFRAMHSIKGAAGFFGFEALKTLSHAMENVFMKFRDGQMVPDPKKTDALLAGADKVRLLVNALTTGENVAYTNELDQLNEILNGMLKSPEADSQKEIAITADTSDGSDVELGITTHGMIEIRVKGGPGLGDAVFELNNDVLLSECTNRGQLLYAVWIDPVEDLEKKKRSNEEFFSSLGTLGKCIRDDFGDKNAMDRETPAKKEPFFHLLFGTIIDSDLIEDALEIPAAQIKVLDSALLDIKTAAVKPLPAQKQSVTAAEEKLPPLLPSPPSASKGSAAKSSETIRVSVELIDKLMNLAGELVLGRNQLRQELTQAVCQTPKLSLLMQDVDSVTSDVQELIMRMRMQPVGNLFNKFIRVVRDLSRQLQKETELVIEGETVELDKSILEGLSDPMTHLIRNCMDHAMESPEKREQAGKPRTGKLQIKAFHEGGQVNILVVDDGKGIDPVAVAEKAAAIGAFSNEVIARMSDKEKLNLIFMPGLSTAETISDVSGRGVGMDVVKTNIEKLGGYVEIDSIVGEGTSVRIRLPLTLAIIPCLTVGTAGQRFAIPQVNVQELVRIRAADVPRRIEKIGDVEVLRLREKLLPLACLADVLELERTIIHPRSGEDIKDQRRQLADRRLTKESKINKTQESSTLLEEKRSNRIDRRHYWQSDINVVVLRIGAHCFGITVEELFDNEEIVVKPLSKYVKKSRCFAGATIMGDGKVAMILDTAGIAEFSNLYFAEDGEAERRRREEEARTRIDALGKRQSILLFNNAYGEQFAFRLKEISRLEKISPDSIHSVGTQDYLEYRNKGLPIIHLEKLLPVSSVSEGAAELFVIIPKTKGGTAGILVSHILDTVETQVVVQKDATTPPGVYGSAFIGGELTMFLNPDELLKMFETHSTPVQKDRRP